MSNQNRKFTFQEISGPPGPPGVPQEIEGLQIHFAHPPPFAIVTKDGRVFIPEQQGNNRTMIDLVKKVRAMELEWAMRQANGGKPPRPPEPPTSEV